MFSQISTTGSNINAFCENHILSTSTDELEIKFADHINEVGRVYVLISALR